jgi:uncharacterized membrane protein
MPSARTAALVSRVRRRLSQRPLALFFNRPSPTQPFPRRFYPPILWRTFRLGWIPAVVVLGMKRFRGDFKMRFHAFQGLYIFAAWLIVEWAIHPLFENMRHVFRVDSILSTLLMFVWIFMLVKTSQGEIYELPIVGELAQRSAREKP